MTYRLCGAGAECGAALLRRDVTRPDAATYARALTPFLLALPRMTTPSARTLGAAACETEFKTYRTLSLLLLHAVHCVHS
ncbi:jg4097 [Pararge aegeria aegeria]|uniref:Jg4097 protein n=1 Tax=Pararge aegeria aegeria TaxID=348720 RepID=A0A8S4RVS9_9NEOP|nr:jg4097 [Pararge aegeria aegeria]